MVNFLLRLHSGYTKYAYFLYLWESRTKHEHRVRKDWLQRQQVTVDENNILYEPLVSRDKIIFPTLHVKLGLMKQFVKALDKEGACF